MTGPIEEAGSTARSLIDALKAQPVMLGLLIIILGLLIFIFYALHAAAASREKLLDQVFKNGREIQELLSKCVVPGRTELEQPQKRVEAVQEPLKLIEQP